MATNFLVVSFDKDSLQLKLFYWLESTINIINILIFNILQYIEYIYFYRIVRIRSQ